MPKKSSAKSKESKAFPISLAFFASFIFSLITLPLLALPFLIRYLIQKKFTIIVNLFKYGALILLSLPILLYFLYPYQNFSQQEEVVRDISSTVFFAGRGIDFISSPPNNLVYGGLVQTLNQFRAPKDSQGVLNTEEHSLSFNLIPVVLFILGLIYLKKHKFTDKWYFYTLLIFSLIMVLGSSFTGWNSDTGSFNLPYYYLYHWIPVLQGLRVPTRFEFLSYISVALIATLGMKYLLEKYPKQSVMIFLIAISLITIENLTAFNFSDRSQALELSHSSQLPNLENKSTLHYPTYIEDMGKQSFYLNWATQTREKTMNFNNGYIPEDQAEFFGSIQSIDQNLLKKLSALGIDYLIEHNSDGSFKLTDIKALNLQAKACSWDDLTKTVHTGTTQDFTTTFTVLEITDSSDCYLASPYQDRYKTISIDIDGVQKQVDLRLPILISPGDKVDLDEYDKTLIIR